MASEVFGKRPFDFPPNLRSVQKLDLLREQKLTPMLPTDCPKEVAALIEKCIDRSPSKRPSFIEIASALQSMKGRISTDK